MTTKKSPAPIIIGGLIAVAGGVFLFSQQKALAAPPTGPGPGPEPAPGESGLVAANTPTIQ